MKTLIAFAGLPASGKSAVAVQLQQTLEGCLLLDKDTVREFLFQEYVDYTDKQNDVCIDLIFQVAQYLMSIPLAPTVIIDGRSFAKRQQIEALKRAASAMQCRLCLIECVCSEATAKQRLAKDQGIHPAEDRDFELYLRCKASAEPIVEQRLILDTDQNTSDDCCQQVLAYLKNL